jgi:ParB-like chromosome segregation protein Spo0J
MEIAVSRKGGARLMDGNHRLIVAREVGLSTVPVAFLIVPYRDDRFILP